MTRTMTRLVEDSPCTSARASSMISVDRTKSVVVARLMMEASSAGLSSPAAFSAAFSARPGWRMRSRTFSPPSKHR